MNGSVESRDSKTILRIGTRRSALAMTQSRYVATCLGKLPSAPQVELVPITTKGDLDQKSPLPEIGGKGLFTEELEHALLSSQIDAAVHSLKDLPGQLPAGLILAAVPDREDPRDVLVARGEASCLEDLPTGARVGTSSLRRAAQLRAFRQDLQIVDLRGNVKTRLRKVSEGQVDAAVLAYAGLLRLGLTDQISCVLSLRQMLPAPGQGCLGIEARKDDPRVGPLLAQLNCEQARNAATAERTLLMELGGGCSVPLAAHAVLVAPGTLELTALVASPDGSRILRASGRGNDPAKLGSEVADELKRLGAAEVLDA